jgi:hypothetical protein
LAFSIAVHELSTSRLTSRGYPNVPLSFIMMRLTVIRPFLVGLPQVSLEVKPKAGQMGVNTVTTNHTAARSHRNLTVDRWSTRGERIGVMISSGGFGGFQSGRLPLSESAPGADGGAGRPRLNHRRIVREASYNGLTRRAAESSPG